MATEAPRQRKLVWVGGLVLALVAVTIWWVASRSGAEPTAGSPAGSTATGSSATGTPNPSASTSAAQGPGVATSPPAGTPTNPVVTTTGAPATDAASTPVPPRASSVAPTATATGTDRVTVSIAKVESVAGKAVAPGEISGPAVRLTVKVNNGTSTGLNLGLTAVNAYIGPPQVPAGTLMKPGGRPLTGTLAPGMSAEGIYLFQIPVSQRKDVTVTVDYGAGVQTLVFRGPLT